MSTSCPVTVVDVAVGGSGRGEGGLGRGGGGGLRGSCVEFAIVDDVDDSGFTVSSGQSNTGWPRTLPPTP